MYNLIKDKERTAEAVTVHIMKYLDFCFDDEQEKKWLDEDINYLIDAAYAAREINKPKHVLTENDFNKHYNTFLMILALDNDYFVSLFETPNDYKYYRKHIDDALIKLEYYTDPDELRKFATSIKNTVGGGSIELDYYITSFNNRYRSFIYENEYRDQRAEIDNYPYFLYV